MRFGLIGRHLGHSYSPEIHRQLHGNDYQLVPMEPAQLHAFFVRRAFDGINVTIPYKKDAMAFCDTLGETARRAGCVNTIVRRSDGTLYGDNTDLVGFQFMLNQAGISLVGKHVFIVGNGGASLTVQLACADAKAASVTIADKDDSKVCPQAQVIINTSPIGMYPNVNATPVDLRNYPALEAAADLIYNPRRTRFLQQAQQLGLTHVDGLSMLVAQAAAAAALWGLSCSDTQHALNNFGASLENWVLIGMPGCGKSSLGAYLAEQSGRKFVDLDRAISTHVGMSPGEFIQQRGEAVFRDIESEVAAQVGLQTGLVIATGGGAVLRPENVQALRQNGKLLWIMRDPAHLPTQGRPLSTDLEALWQTRKPAYQMAADFMVEHNEDWEQLQQRALKILNCAGGIS